MNVTLSDSSVWQVAANVFKERIEERTEGRYRVRIYPNEQLSALNDAVKGRADIVASGGVHTMEDIVACKEMGLYGTICGKSIYKGTLNLKEAIEYARVE